MPYTVQINVADYLDKDADGRVIPNQPAKAIAFREADKGSRLLACWLITMQSPGGPVGNATGGKISSEVLITERLFAILESFGEIKAVRYQPPRDPIPPVTSLDQTDPWNYMMQIAHIGIAKWLPRDQVVNIARAYGYTGN